MALFTALVGKNEAKQENTLSKEIEMMNRVLEGLEPAAVLGLFSQILTIPRPSHKEEQMVEYLQNWADAQGFRSVVDEYKNLVIFVPATAGFEGAPAIALQTHSDMVTVDDNH